MAEVGKLSGTGTKPFYELHSALTPNDDITVPTTQAVQEALDGDLTPSSITPTLFKVPEVISAPVHAIAASKVLTVGGLPTVGKKVTLGTQDYTWIAALSVAAVAASKVFTLSDVAVAAETVTIDATVFTWVAALTEAKAVSTLTLSDNATDGNSVTIGTTKYTFKETLGTAYDVKIGVSASATLDNLIAAINKAAGEGSTYGTGTVAHTLVTAAAGAGDTMGITAKTIGVAGNSIATTELSGVASWTDVVMAGGVDAVANELLVEATAEACIDNLVAAGMGTAGVGTKYSTGTAVQANVNVVKSTASTVTVTAKTSGTAGNSIAVDKVMTNGSWAGGATALSGGVDAVAQVPYTVKIGVSAEACIDNLVAAITKAAGESTTYGTGTVAHPSVTAAKTTAATMTVTASVKGAGGNSIALAEDDANTSWAGDATALSGGVSGTVGVENEMCRDDSYLYVCIAANTTAGTNWRKVALGSAY